MPSSFIILGRDANGELQEFTVGAGGGLNTSATGGFAVTPHDTNTLARVTRGVYVGTAGDLAVRFQDGSEVTFVGLGAGLWPFALDRVHATDTTAADIVGLY